MHFRNLNTVVRRQFSSMKELLDFIERSIIAHGTLELLYLERVDH